MDVLETVFAKHMEKYHPDSVTARLAREVRRLRDAEVKRQMKMVVDSIGAVLTSGAHIGDALKTQMLERQEEED